MKDDFEIIERRFDKSIKIYPIADVHLGSINHNKKAWEEFIKSAAEDENAYFILNGDLVNNNNGGIKTPGTPWEDNIRPREQKAMMCEYLQPIRERILCIVQGNHEARNKPIDNDITYDIACKLDIEDVYRETAAFVKVCLGEKTHGKNYNVNPRQTYIFCVTHGSGGGALGGGVLNKNERFATGALEGVDCLIVGHTHKGQISRPSKMIADRHHGMVIVRDMLVLSCVSWQNYGGYALRKMLNPSSVANPQILTLEERKHNISVTW